MKFKEDFLPDSIPCATCTDFAKGYPDSVTIHWIGPYPKQNCDIVRNWWLTGGQQGSAHLIVHDENVMQCWPFTRTAWHAGNSKGNNTSIGIEVVPRNEDGEFSDASIETLKEALDKFFPGLPLKRHYDWSKKDCPRYYVDEERWAALKERLGRP